jgi:hypothetical protein
VISDRDVWAAALLMVKRYGDDAMLGRLLRTWHSRWGCGRRQIGRGFSGFRRATA